MYYWFLVVIRKFFPLKSMTSSICLMTVYTFLSFSFSLKNFFDKVSTSLYMFYLNLPFIDKYSIRESCLALFLLRGVKFQVVVHYQVSFVFHFLPFKEIL